MIERLEIIEKRYNEIVDKLNNRNTSADYKKIMKLKKEKTNIDERKNT